MKKEMDIFERWGPDAEVHELGTFVLNQRHKNVTKMKFDDTGITFY